MGESFFKKLWLSPRTYREFKPIVHPLDASKLRGYSFDSFVVDEAAVSYTGDAYDAMRYALTDEVENRVALNLYPDPIQTVTPEQIFAMLKELN